jgi:hypothetical protein
MATTVEWLYYLLQTLIVLASLTIGLICWTKIKQHEYLKLFPLYSAVSLFTTLPWFFNQLVKFPGILIGNIFIAFEFYIFYNFFIKILKGKFYFILTGLSLLFFLCAIIVIYFLYNHQNTYTTINSLIYRRPLSELMFIANLFYIVPALLYYISLFNRPYIQNLTADPVFLATSGILFCFSISTPLFAFIKVIDENKTIFSYLYIINSLAYIILHLFFIKAYKCIK